MKSAAHPAYRVDLFVVDLQRGVLLAEGVERPLRAKSFALLRLLVEHPGRLVDRDEITAAVWPGLFVTDDSIAQCVRDIRRALGDSGLQLLRTMKRRGYLLTAQVKPETDPAAPAAPAEIKTPARSSAACGRRPTSRQSRCCRSRT